MYKYSSENIIEFVNDQNLYDSIFLFVCSDFVQYYSNCSYLCLLCPGLCFKMYITDRQKEGCEIFYLLFCVIQEGKYIWCFDCFYSISSNSRATGSGNMELLKEQQERG